MALLRTRGASSTADSLTPEAAPHPVTVGGRPASADFFIDLIPQFSEFVFPLNPIISPDEIRQAIENMYATGSPEDTALVYAFAAMTINRTRSSWTVSGELATLMADLVQSSTKAYRAIEMDSMQSGALRYLPVTVKRVLTAVFLSVCVLTLGHVDRSATMLREAVTVLESRRIHRPDSAKDDLRWQRLYWETYIHERHMAISAPFRVILPALRSGLPLMDADIAPHVDVGFRRLVSLFLIVDDTFVAYWQAQQGPEAASADLTAEWIDKVQLQLDQDAEGTDGEEERLRAGGQGGLTELQRIDLGITRLWLRTLVWQMALSGGLLCSSPTHKGLSLRFPVTRICGELAPLFTRLKDVTSVGYHGMGMLQKLFDITSTIADVLALPGTAGEVEESENVYRVQELLFVSRLLLAFKAMPGKQKEYLNSKLEALARVYTMVDFGNPLDET